MRYLLALFAFALSLQAQSVTSVTFDNIAHSSCAPTTVSATWDHLRVRYFQSATHTCGSGGAIYPIE